MRQMVMIKGEASLVSLYWIWVFNTTVFLNMWWESPLLQAFWINHRQGKRPILHAYTTPRLCLWTTDNDHLAISRARRCSSMQHELMDIKPTSMCLRGQKCISLHHRGPNIILEIGEQWKQSKTMSYWLSIHWTIWTMGWKCYLQVN